MQHALIVATLSLTTGAVLATVVFPQSITANNEMVANRTADTASSSVAASEVHGANAGEATVIPEVQMEPEVIANNDQPAVTSIQEEVSERIRQVPFFSQFADIDAPEWRKVACGVASLAMLVNYYQPDATTANALLDAGIAADAYTDNGWSHAGLIGLAQKFDLTGSTNSLSHLSAKAAMDELASAVAEGPVMVSVHYTFEPTNPIPHLVVVTDITDGYVHYNDPAEKRGNGFITIEKFAKSWKQRYIEIRPTT